MQTATPEQLRSRRMVRELVDSLSARPGRGGVRLSYEQAQLALGLIREGAGALQRERKRLGWRSPLLEEIETGERVMTDA